MIQQKFRIIGMHCTACVMRVEGLEDDLPGVRRVKANYRKGQMEIEYDEARVSSTEIIAAVEQLGYQASLD